jgi:hypothetical protein
MAGGWWYIAFGIVFSVYAIDLIFLFLASLFATVVEYFVPPISTAASRAAKQRQRLASAKQQHGALKARGKGGKAAAAAAAQPGKATDLAIVVDTRGAADGGAVKAASAIPGEDRFSHLTDLYRGEFPKVMIQLPMYNEDAHCDLIIQRCCKVMWPSHRILIQVGPRGGGGLGGRRVPFSSLPAGPAAGMARHGPFVLGELGRRRIPQRPQTAAPEPGPTHAHAPLPPTPAPRSATTPPARRCARRSTPR